MAQKPHTMKKLTFVDIIMGADAETIKSAFEARVKIDGLLAEREDAYRKIVDLENQIEGIVGDPGVFVYPPPPCPVAGFEKPEPTPRRQPKSLTPRAPTDKDADEESPEDAVADDGGDNSDAAGATENP